MSDYDVSSSSFDQQVKTTLREYVSENKRCLVLHRQFSWTSFAICDVGGLLFSADEYFYLVKPGISVEDLAVPLENDTIDAQSVFRDNSQCARGGWFHSMMGVERRTKNRNRCWKLQQQWGGRVNKSFLWYRFLLFGFFWHYISCIITRGRPK